MATPTNLESPDTLIEQICPVRALRRGRNKKLTEHLVTTPANPEENRQETLSMDPQTTEQVKGTGRTKTGKTV